MGQGLVVLGEPIAIELFDGEARQRALEASQRVDERGDWIGEMRQLTKDGQEILVESFENLGRSLSEVVLLHGRHREPCPDCGAPVQRIAYADNETNYCAGCQTEGKLLKDRALSRLLKDDWPKSLDELDG